MADSADEPGLGERINHPLPRLQGVGDRLLDERVHSGSRQLQRRVLMEPGRDRDNRNVDTGVDQCVDVGQHFEIAGDTVGVASRVRDRDEVDALDLAQHACVVAAHHANAEQPGPKISHQAPAPATVFTAATMRSRSPCDSDGCTGSDTTSRAARSVSGRSSPGAKCASDGRRWFGIG